MCDEYAVRLSLVVLLLANVHISILMWRVRTVTVDNCAL